MQVTQLDIAGSWVATPVQHSDDRGTFLEWFRADLIADATGHRLDTVQANLSRSARGVVRGVHFADVPPGQAKYVTCVRGSVVDVVVDLRVGSPTFGRSVPVPLDDVDRRGVLLAEGLGHAFMALTDDALVSYLCSTPYSPTREHGVHPLDPDLALPWPADVPPLLSPKDEAAPSLSEAVRTGLLPTWEACQEWYVRGGATSSDAAR